MAFPHHWACSLQVSAAMRTLCLLLLIVPYGVRAQSGIERSDQRIEILNADEWTFDEAYAPGTQRLKGDVRFKHEGALMTCDSAWIRSDQSVDAYGSIHIRQGDTLLIQSDRLSYSGKQRIAQLQGNVHLSDPATDLTTEHLTYDLGRKVASYTGGGTIISRKDQNTLTSGNGSYLTGAHMFIFSRNVRLDHPDRTITADTLHYTTTSGVASFHGPTEIVQDSTRILCTLGSYDTRQGFARFRERTRILTQGQEVQGDSIHYDRNTGIGLAWGEVAIIDTANALSVTGDQGRFNERTEATMITGHAEMSMGMGADTLFLHGDSLFAAVDSLKKRRITAYQGVRFYKRDLQGVCDTLIYAEADSMIHLYGSPFLWSRSDQINGKRMRIAMRDGRIHRLYVDQDAFMISQVDSIHFDQVTGTQMTGYFTNDELDRLIAEGNSRTVYFVRETTDGEERIIGVNRADCSKIEVLVSEQEIQAISFLTRPDAVMYPLEKVPEEELVLRGFRWNIGARPMDRKSIFGPEDL